MEESSFVLSYSSQSWSSPSSDSDIYNTSSPEVGSPLSSLDFSPVRKPQDIPETPRIDVDQNSLETLRPTAPVHYEDPSAPGRRTRTRSKNPSRQRQNASEKEKLRMRDLTKALHHLRSFLPPSVAPVGQTLTKIETLRLTIRYISYLSSQLGEEPPGSERDPLTPRHVGIYRYSSVPEAWKQDAHTEALRPHGHCCPKQAGLQNRMDTDIFGSTELLDCVLHCPPHTQTAFSYQDPHCKGVHYESLAPAFWS